MGHRSGTCVAAAPPTYRGNALTQSPMAAEGQEEASAGLTNFSPGPAWERTAERRARRREIPSPKPIRGPRTTPDRADPEHWTAEAPQVYCAAG